MQATATRGFTSGILTAAVTQASLQSIIHKFLTAGPSAFNITSLISQAAQLSTQGSPSSSWVTLGFPLCFVLKLRESLIFSSRKYLL